MAWLYEALVNESRWIAPSVALAALLAFRAFRTTEAGDDLRVAAALSVYAGAMVGTMAFGHLFAISLKLAAGDLNGALPALVGIGIVLAVPSWLVVRHGWGVGRGKVVEGRETIILNLLLVGALLVTGPRNAPLAIPALLNTIHAGAHRVRVKQATVALAVAFSLLLFAGSVRFFISGQSFEDFSGMETPSR